MMDLRYHLISLTAIFLALTVGIVIGSSLGSSERQTRVVERLQAEFQRVMEADRRIQSENQALRRRLEAREEAARKLLPSFVQNRIAGLRLAVVVCGDGFTGAALDGLRQSLALAGAEVTSVTRLPANLGLLPAALRPALPAEGGDGTPEGEERAAVRAVVRAILSGNAGGRLAEIARATGTTLEGSHDAPVRRLLIVGAPEPPDAGETAPPDPAAGRLAQAAVDAARDFIGVRVLAAVPEGAHADAFLRGAAERRLRTFDDIDTAAGQIALVLELEASRAGSGASSGSSPSFLPR